MKILKSDSEMDQEDIFASLPPDIMLNILSRIPFKTVFACKCVSKSWLDLLETPEFTRSHLSKSVPGLLVHHATETNLFRIYECEDSLEIERHELHYNKVLDLDLERDFRLSRGSRTTIEGSANGLLFMQNRTLPYIDNYYIDNYVCNPITREFIELPKPEGIPQNCRIVTYGFGVSRLSNKYKVVRIFHERFNYSITGSLFSIPKSVWQVYTHGTESWRNYTTPCEMLLDYNGRSSGRLLNGNIYDYSGRSSGKLLNGNIYWLAADLNGSWWISCFDLETEVFTKFRAPIGGYHVGIGVLRDRLCFCDNSSVTEFSIYLMNDYGEEKISWNKEYAISKIHDFPDELFGAVYPVKAFGDGDILMLSKQFPCMFYYYSNRTKTISKVNMLNGYTYDIFDVVLYIPSFLSLKDFETENVKVLEFVCSMS